MTDRIGQQLGNYILTRLLGRGMFAEVYVGEHVYLKNFAALKVLDIRLTDEAAEQFLREAQTLVRLFHPSIVRVLDFSLHEGAPFFVMEYAPGGTLRQRHPKGTLVPLATIVSYVKQVAEALQYTHEQGVIHRDVKPENLVLGRNNEVLLSDFGIAIMGQSLPPEQTPEIAGTVAYTAPEQIQGHPRPASDQYTLAAVVYEWLSGDWPFRGETFEEIASQHLSVSPPSLCARVPTIPPAVERVVLRGLAKDPQQRFANVKAFALALEEAARVESSPHPAETGRRNFSIDDLPRGTVTLLFTDIEGSTHLLRQLGDRYASVLSECRQLLRAVFQEWSGREVDTQGDAFFVAFARATDAVLAAVDAQRALANHPWPEGVAVRVRMGLHTGEPALTSEGYIGLDVHRAARIMSAGHGGQVLLSQTTCNLVEQDLPDDVGLRDLGEHRLKDLGRSRRLFQLVISDLPADFPALRTLDSFPNNLPVQPTPFLGREKELAIVGDLLRREDVHLVTLTGAGGSGKTRLGLQVAAELSDLFADGVFFVNLAPISDPAFVVPTIVETLGLREGVGQLLLERLREELRQKHMLLLLDNFEQVVSAAEQVGALLVACPQLKVLVTSREVLHVRAEHEFAVPPLVLPDLKHLPNLAVLSQYAAIALFIQRAQAVKPDFQMTNANARAIVEICARLDGLPLAIELAAARMKLLTPQALLARLGQRLQVLIGMARDVPTRQQTLRNTIEWSYNLLDEQEQRLFRRLSVFVGGCTLEAVEDVHSALGDGEGAAQILNRVASLIDKSLLQQSEQTVEGQEPRLMMLETIREYGLECLTENGEVEAIRQAHADYYLALAETAEPEFAGPQQGAWLDRLEREYDNLRAALQWLVERAEGKEGEEAKESKEMALRLSYLLAAFSSIRGHWSEVQTFLERALAGSDRVAPSVRLKALHSAGGVAFALGDLDRAEMLARESLALCRKLGDEAGIALSLFRLGAVFQTRGDLVLTRSLLEEALALWRKVGDKDGLASSLHGLAYLDYQLGEYARTRALFEESVVLRRALGNKRDISGSLFRLAEMLFLSQDDPGAVRSLLEESLKLCRELGDKDGIAYCFRLSGQVALSQDDPAMARSLAEESVALFRELGNQWGTAESLSLLGQVAAVRGDYTTARTLYEESLDITKGAGDKLNISSYLEGLAGVVAAQGELIWAMRLWGAAEVLRDAMGTPIPPVYRAEYERAITVARNKLGEKAFATAWAEGRSMTPDQALAARGTAISTTIVPDGPHPPKDAISYLAGLTTREVEVLRLVAQGMTNEQAAEQLVISPRTVNTHLTSIYGKIGVSTRSAATRYAMEHKLL